MNMQQQQPMRRGIAFNHNQTLVRSKQRARRGIRLNHNQTLVRSR
ncbi:MAG: hypothetical protein R3C14_42510 [Caldilineaceae bacterium]